MALSVEFWELILLKTNGFTPYAQKNIIVLLEFSVKQNVAYRIRYRIL